MNHRKRRTLTLAAICLLVTTASCRLAGQLLGNEAQPQSGVTQPAITAAPATESSPPESTPDRVAHRGERASSDRAGGGGAYSNLRPSRRGLDSRAVLRRGDLRSRRKFRA